MDSNPTLQRALTRWLIIHGSGKAKTTRHTYRENVKQIRKAWRSILKCPVNEIGDDCIARFVLACDHYCAARWNAMVSILRATVPAAKDLKRRPIPLTRQPPPTQQEFSKLIDEAEKLARSNAREVIEFLSHSGLRIGGAKKVQWTDVLDDRIQYIAKGGRICSVPIINGMRDVLNRLKRLDDGSGYVLPRGTIKRGLKIACERAGVRQLNHHDFRHLFATRCIESGVDVPTLARWMGHKDGGALLSKRYFHLLDEHSRRMAELVRI